MNPGAGCLGIMVIDIDPEMLTNVMRQSGLLREASGLVLVDATKAVIAKA